VVEELKIWKSTESQYIQEGAQISFTDEKMASKLTSVQKSIIRLHQQLTSALQIVQKLPIENQKTPQNSGLVISVYANYNPVELKSGFFYLNRNFLIG
jgi:hypothetical protein